MPSLLSDSRKKKSTAAQRPPTRRQTAQTTESTLSTAPAIGFGPDSSPQVTPGNVLQLQRTIGNQAVQRLLAEQRGSTTGVPSIQPKGPGSLQVGAANDRYEQEADRVAKQVTSGDLSTSAPPSIQPARQVQLSRAFTPTIQRKTRNLPIDSRLTSGIRNLGYTKSIETPLAGLVANLNKYNQIPKNDTGYDQQLQLLNVIMNDARGIHQHLNTSGFMQKKGTVRSYGGPARLGYYHLIRKLTQLSGGSYEFKDHKGLVEYEIEAVEAQSGKPTVALTSAPQRPRPPRKQHWEDATYEDTKRRQHWGLSKVRGTNNKVLAGRAGYGSVPRTGAVMPDMDHLRELTQTPLEFSEQGLEGTKQVMHGAPISAPPSRIAIHNPGQHRGQHCLANKPQRHHPSKCWKLPL